ncbi:MAG: FMN-binding protein [Treponema sp.]|jgi:electron transport complex protein RnfG|nr:FMN-binding protein [Treponema sp.]
MKAGEIVKLGLVLTIYAAAACAGLALVYSGTRETIAQRTQADLEAALKELFPAADGFDEIDETITSPEAAVSFEKQYAVKQGGRIIGAALRARGGSYGGPITVLVGISADGTISRIKIMEHADTPGLGANAASPDYFIDQDGSTTFYGQFAGKAAADPFEVKSDVAAITAATITSRAVAAVVKASGEAALEWLGKNGGTQ